MEFFNNLFSSSIRRLAEKVKYKIPNRTINSNWDVQNPIPFSTHESFYAESLELLDNFYTRKTRKLKCKQISYRLLVRYIYFLVGSNVNVCKCAHYGVKCLHCRNTCVETERDQEMLRMAKVNQGSDKGHTRR